MCTKILGKHGWGRQDTSRRRASSPYNQIMPEIETAKPSDQRRYANLVWFWLLFLPGCALWLFLENEFGLLVMICATYLRPKWDFDGWVKRGRFWRRYVVGVGYAAFLGCFFVPKTVDARCIAGIIIGGFVFALAVLDIIHFCRRRAVAKNR